MPGESNILAQSVLTASTLTDLLTVTTPVIVDAIYICNQDTVGVTARLAIAASGAAIAAGQYLLYDVAIGPGRTLAVDLPPNGIRLGSGAIIRAFADSASVSFTVFGA